MNIGEQIKKYRKMRGMTQRELGRRCGVSGQYIQMLELKKNNNPSLKVINYLCEALEITVSELLDLPNAVISAKEVNTSEPDITQFTTDELLKEIVRRIS